MYMERERERENVKHTAVHVYKTVSSSCNTQVHLIPLTGFLKGRIIVCLLRLWNMLAGVVGLATIKLYSVNWPREKSSLVISPASGISASSQLA